jgi:peptidylprolyl isomerase
MIRKLLLGFALFFSAQVFAQSSTEVTFYTTLGDFVVEMEDSLAPITSGNFISLVEDKFYDGIIFHRVISSFIIQGGDPTGTGTGGSGVTIPDEFHPDLDNIVRTISMANSGPNTGTSQFFINMVNNTYLDYDRPPLTSAHPVFGTVIEGWPIVTDISNVPTNSFDRPIDDVVMDSLRITNPLPSGLGPILNWTGHLQSLKLYPQPANMQSKISFELLSGSALQFQLFNQNGQLIASRQEYLPAGQHEIVLADLSEQNLISGQYILMLEDEVGARRQAKILIP